MFNDKRSKKLVFVSHCILNQNAISDSTADFPGTFSQVVNEIVKHDIGIVQMPCPELLCLGLDRGDITGHERPVVVENTRIRNELNADSSQMKINQIVNCLHAQLTEYLKYDFNILGIIGINRSPSCGVETTSDNNEEAQGKGVFMKALLNKLESDNIHLKYIGIKTSEPDASLEKVSQLLDN